MSILLRAARSTVALAAALALAATSGCATAPPTPEELISIGFRDPEQAFKTFQSAVGADLIDLEYRCYSAEFKGEWKITQGNYRVARRDLFEQMPWVRRISRAEVRGIELLEPGLAQLDARVSFLMQTVDIEVFLAREDFYELWAGNKRIADGELRYHDSVSRISEGEGFERVERLLTELELEAPVSPRLAAQLDQVTEVRVGREWRIAGMRVRSEAGSAP